MSLVALWDKDQNIIASQADAAHPKTGQVTVKGDGNIRAAVSQLISRGLIDEPLYVTVDIGNHEYVGGARRRGGRVTLLSVRERPCECGRDRLVSTTIGWLS